MESVLKAVQELYNQHNVNHLPDWYLRDRAEVYGNFTRFGNVVFHTTVKNRSAGATVYIGGDDVKQAKLNDKQKEILKNLDGTLKKVHEYMKKAPFICIDRTMGENSEFNPRCTLFVSVQRKESIRLAYMCGATLFPYRKEAKGPHLNLVYIPEWQEKDRQILVFPDEGVTYVLGSDYYGESKKGFLRMAMWKTKKQGWLGLHAGAKTISARDKEGNLRRYGMLIFGLTATGKTTHTCHDHGLCEKDENVKIVQDDIVMWKPDGSALGTEKGFYIKTEGMNPDSQPLLYKAVTQRDTILENIMIDYNGNVDFDDETLTSNGRGIIQREDLGDCKSDELNLPPAKDVDGLIIAFITRRNTVVPLASKLTPEQAAAFFMLGESVESSGGDPKKAGMSVREVGTNPFIVGDDSFEGNRFYEFVKKLGDKAQCYLLNTGGVGEIIEEAEGKREIKRKVKRVEILEMAAIIRGMAKNTIKWEADPHFDTVRAEKVEGADISKYAPENFYEKDQLNALVQQLRKERIEYLEKFPGLNSAIVDAVKPAQAHLAAKK